MDNLWKDFAGLASESYTNMIQSELNMDVWHEAFATVIEIVNCGREQNSNFAPEFCCLDEDTDYSYDVQGWFDDYVEELDMRGWHDEVCEVCHKMLHLFRWEEESPSTLYFHMASALGEEGRIEEALVLCEEWYKKEEDEESATALIYARTAVKDYDGAEQIVKQYIPEDDLCHDENDMIFTAAEQLYKVSGNKEAEKKIKQAMQRYEEEWEKELVYSAEGVVDKDWPFN